MASASAPWDFPRKGLHPEGFVLKMAGDNLVILGGDRQALKGSNYGALAFLSDESSPLASAGVCPALAALPWTLAAQSPLR